MTKGRHHHPHRDHARKEPDLIRAEDPTPSPDGASGSSLLLQAIVGVVKARSKSVDDTAGTRDINARQQIEGVTRTDTDLGRVPAITLEPQFNQPDRTVVYFHGGGYVSGSPPDRYLPLAAAVVLGANARVHVVDYRLAPETPFPGAFDDCLAAYRWLIDECAADPATLAVLGDSAGGNLAIAVTVAARDEGLALPASVAVISPFADLTLTGASINQRKEMDPYVTRETIESMAVTYVGEGARNDPRCSAVFADLKGLPPLFIQVGENEILYDDATRIRDAALGVGVEVTFESWRHGIHDWPVYVFAGVPESAIAIDHLAAFFRAHTNPGAVGEVGAQSQMSGEP
ncbi:MAG: epsilon-lactone hydrolase [Mycobacterium sp.]|jgi:acetyl esterase/lipase|nr:epsilon-lactone hydrolase [Mycobacterium sp.]MDT5286607.1 epsilon-lactone hydrolase [Mycobacterium sp.]MDT5363885.1 epsilon-lactone hydrolase [Mycobacterium sp.]